jgi:methanogenic corrinoid protein MtbC1
MTRQERKALGERLWAGRDLIADRVNEEFFQRYPSWRQRYGQKGVEHGREDARFHIDFLRGALEADSVVAIEDYVRWTSNVLNARGIAPRYLAENLQQIANATRDLLNEAEQAQVEAFIRAGIRILSQTETASPTALARAEPKLDLTCRLFTQAILLGQRKAAVNLAIEAIEKGAAPLDVYIDVLQEAMFEVGRLWEKNKITVAEEHMATAITQYVIGQLYPHIERAATAKGRIVVTGVQGELHHIGPNIVADVLEARGWDVQFLGTNLPHADILRVIEKHHAEVVGISVTMLFNIPQLIRLIESLDRAFGPDRVRVIVGGGAFRNQPDLWKQVGAQGFAHDARQATTLVERWTNATA